MSSRDRALGQIEENGPNGFMATQNIDENIRVQENLAH
jgi:hypothetical protein